MSNNTKKPILSVVRESDSKTASATSTPVAPSIEASEHNVAMQRRLARWGSDLQSAAKLSAIGTVLAEGAYELRPCMSATSAKAWLKHHVERIDRKHLDVIGSEEGVVYEGMRDLREAVIGAAAELDEAGVGAPRLVSALYEMAKKIETGEQITKAAPKEEKFGFFSRWMQTYRLGLDALTDLAHT